MTSASVISRRRTKLRDVLISPFAGFPPEVQQRLAAQADPTGPHSSPRCGSNWACGFSRPKVPLEFLVIDAVQKPTPN
jgi:hypothetical protein